MKRRMLNVLGVLSALSLVWTGSVQATTIRVGTNLVFATNYEGGTATSLTFGNAANTATGNDFDPPTPLTGSWWTAAATGSTGIYEGNGNSGSFNYNTDSKQVQVTSSTATSGTGLNFDPGPYQGTQYLRGYRTNVSGSFNGKWEAFPAPLTTSGSDTITFESAVYVTPFSAAGTNFADLVTGYNNFLSGTGNFAQRFRLTVDANGNLRNGSAGPAILDPNNNNVVLPLGQWNILTVSYTEGAASTWSVAVNGGTPITGLAPTSLGSLGGLSFGGGQQASARLADNTGAPLVYFDAVPEPGSISLASLGSIVIVSYCRRKRRLAANGW